MQLISILKIIHVPLYASTCSLGEFDEKKNISKFQRLEILNQKAIREMTFLLTIQLFNSLWLNVFALDGSSHV
jgi:hypothetical protein